MEEGNVHRIWQRGSLPTWPGQFPQCIGGRVSTVSSIEVCETLEGNKNRPLF